MQTSRPTMIESGVDYLTVTSDIQSNMRRFVSTSKPIFKAEEQSGNEIKPWSGMGYNGFRCGGLQLGERHDSMIARLSSDVASRHWQRFVELSSNVTRIDLQVTVRFDEDIGGKIESYYEKAREFLAGKPHAPQVHKYVAADQSATTYLGSRVSEKFGRVYDKGRESKLLYYRNCVRYEVEYKGAQAQRIACWLSRQTSTQEATAGQVWQFFAARGVDVPISTHPVEHICSPRKRTDTERRLKWLENNVRSCVENLINLGLRDEVMRALNIPETKRARPTRPGRASGRKAQVTRTR